MKKIIAFLVSSILIALISIHISFAQSWNITGNSNATSSSKLGTTNNVPLKFFTNNSQRMILDSLGRIGIGITKPVNIFTVKSGGGTPATSWLNGLNTPVFVGFGETVSSEFLLAGASNTAVNRAVFQGRRSRGTLASPTAVANDDYITSLLASAYDGSTFQNPALVSFFVDGTPSSGNVPTRISFVTGSNASNRAERLKVGSTGNFDFNNGQVFLRQSDGVFGIGTTAPNTSSILDLTSTSRGLLIPRMSTTQRNAIASPAQGLLIFQTDGTKGFYYYDGTWKQVGVSASGANTILSNLTSPTAINQHLLPNTTKTFDLGSSSFSWRNLYLRDDIYLDGTRFVSNAPGTASLNVFVGSNAGLAVTSGTNNTAMGHDALRNDTSGIENTAVGMQAMYSNTAGNYNTAIGTQSLYANKDGIDNTAVGYYSLYHNVSASENSALGAFALYSNTKGTNNTAVGSSALFSDTLGSQNTSIGAFSLTINDGDHNTAIGYNSMTNNTTGNRNVAVGSSTMNANTTGNYNTALGFSALYSNTYGGQNTAIGISSLYANTQGNNNTAVGSYSLSHNNYGMRNTALGFASLFACSSGGDNTAIGHQSLQNNTTGSNNIALGSNSLNSNQTGSENIAIGFQALYSNNQGRNNTAIGYQSLYKNEDFNNNAHGYQALYTNRSGYHNNAFGNQSLYFSFSGGGDNAFGYQSLYNTSTGSGNSAFGDFALISNTTGGGNTAFGAQTNVSAGNLQNATALGYQAYVNASNKVRIGNTLVTVVESQAGSWTTSDGRFKSNIKEEVKGLEFIKLLRPVVYNFDVAKYEAHLMQNAPDSIKSKTIQESGDEAKKITAIRQTGLVAQEVEQAAEKISYDFNGVHAPENPTDNWSLSYEKLTVPLVKAVQELSKMNDEKDVALQQQNIKIEDLQKQIDNLKSMIISYQPVNNQQTTISSASLEQNIPNPFQKTTTIGYTLPQDFTNAQIRITDKLGKILKTINISGSGKGTINVDAAILSSGAYNYSLFINGKLISTKQMERLK